MPEHIQLINPNLHVITIHFPIALLFVGTAIELLSFMWRRSSFRAAGRWMILIGALASIPAATTGMYAARQAMGESESTLDGLKREAPLNNDQWDHLRHHIKFNASAAVVLSLLVITWIGASDRFRRSAHLAYVLMLLLAVALIVTGAWHGGELIYSHGTGTHLVKGGWPAAKEHEKTEAEPTTGQATEDGGKWAFDAMHAGEAQIRKMDDTTDVHIQFAGWMAALAVVTLGLSLRNLWLDPRRVVTDDAYASDDDIVNALAGRGEQRALMGDAAETRAPGERPDIPPRVPAARFWLLTALLTLITAVLGWMIVGPGSVKDIIDLLKTTPRYMAHTVAGVSIVVLTLVLALVTRFAPYNRIVVGFFSLLLTLALAAQVWLGILLLFDTTEGTPYRFNAPATQPTTQNLT